MQYLNWELSVLHKAVGFPNLSHAAANIGISQPQLSRVVAKLESDLDLVLLDREIKRKSCWTQEAYRLADIYSRTFQKFQFDINQIKEVAWPSIFRIGVLEGLVPTCVGVVDYIMKNTGIKKVQIYVYDTSKLEERFLENEIDVLFSFRIPNKKKFKYLETVAYQDLDPSSAPKDPDSYVVSEFEYTSQQYKKIFPRINEDTPLIITNSLYVRKEWISRFKGATVLPSVPYKEAKHTGTEVSLFIMAHDFLPQKLWNVVLDGFKKARFS